MSQREASALFWLFLAIFLAIGVVAIVLIFGVGRRVSPRTRHSLLSVYVLGVTTAVITLFRSQFLSPLYLYVPLDSASDHEPDLQQGSGRYSYDEVSKDGQVKTREGWAELAHGPGGWQAKLPREVFDRCVRRTLAVRLSVKDKAGNTWHVENFYPNFNAQKLIEGPAITGQLIPDRRWRLGPGRAMAQGTKGRAHGRAAPIKFDNCADRLQASAGNNQYEWRVFVDEPANVLQSIKEVQYTLHPTFPNPTRTSRDRDKQFELVASGWGEFRILVTVRYVDGQESKTTYMLDLSKRCPDDQ